MNPPLQRLNFSIHIDASPETVWDCMLGPDSYRDWTSAFAEGSRYEGSWEQGQRIRFLGAGDEGMEAQIAENRRHAFLSIRHLGMIGAEAPADSAGGWAFENYRFTREGSGTRLDIEQDVPAEYLAMMNESWPKALQRLKALSESTGGVRA